MSLILALVLSAGPAAPVPPPPARAGLWWRTVEGCPGAAEGRAHVEHYLGGPIPPGRRTGVTLDGDAGGFLATIEVDGASRSLRSRDCEHLARAAALIVAVGLDPVAVADALPETAPSSAAPTTPVPAPAVPAPETPAPAPETPARLPTEPPPLATRPARGDRVARRAEPSRPSPTHHLNLAGGITRALTPAIAGSVRLGYALMRGAFRLEADVLYATPRRVAYPEDPEVGGRFQAITAGVRACVAPTAGPVTVPLCAGLEGGPIVGRGFGVEREQRPVDGWIGGQAGAAALFRVHPRLAVSVDGDLAVPFRRPAFHVDGRETLFRSPQVGVRALAGLELRLR